jgi:sulfotransferase family protein
MSDDVPKLAGPPLFLVGAERSGTTLLRLMLDHHPRIAFQFEFELAVDHLSDGSDWPDVAEYLRKMRLDRIFVQSGYEADPSLAYPALVRSFLEQWRAARGKPLVGATIHRHYSRILRVWPEARFIHICRDGRDVARSCVAMGWAGNAWTGIERWLVAETEWSRTQSLVPAERRLEVNYERFIAEPEAVLRDVCAFVGVEFERAMFDYTKTSTYEYPDQKLASRWRQDMPPGDVQLVESRASELLVARGYALSGLPRISVSPARELALRVQDRFARAADRLRVYGPRLFAESFLAQRIGGPAWRERVQLELNRIDTARVK